MAHCDVLIVGAGSAGCVIAARLSEDESRHVVVLEAGSRVVDPDMRRPERWPLNYGRDYDWAYWTTPQPGLGGRRLDWPRGRGIGGSSLLHAMAHMRGCRADFDRWAAATGEERWSWEGMLPFFRRSERFTGGDGPEHGSDGPMPVLLPGPELVDPVVAAYLDAWASLGVPRVPDHNGGEMLGATPNSLTIEHGRRVTSADAYLDPALHRPNLQLIDRAVVHRLLLDGDRVTGVAYDRDGVRATLEADHVVLAAGAVADPLLLLRSGIGAPEVLAAAGVEARIELPSVGRNLQDHLLAAGAVFRSTRPVPPSRLQVSEAMTYLRAGELTAVSGAPDVVVGCVVAASTSERFADVVADVPAGGAFTLLFGVTNPTSRGDIRITGPGVDDPPRIDPAYLSTEHDRTLFRAALEHARLVATAPGLREWVREELLPGASVASPAEVDDFVRQSVITHHHPSGTLGMGSADTAAVTPDLRLRGTANCWVADASVLPSLTAGPIHACVLAVAEAFSARFPG